MAALIEDYGLIGDLQTAALVSRSGSIDWLCFPRFDSGACFAALLGEDDNGRWELSPEAPVTGSSRRYRDDTLVLETISFDTRPWIQGGGWYKTEQTKITERLRRPSRNFLEYQYTVEDPNTWTRPWSAELPMMKVESRIFEYACHEDNHDLENILRVARTQERDAAAGRK